MRAAISAIAEDAWTAIAYTVAIFDEGTRQWISRAEVAEIPFTAFTSKAKNAQVLGRLVVRRIPDFRPDGDRLFDVWRLHAFFTTSALDTVTADRVHRVLPVKLLGGDGVGIGAAGGGEESVEPPDSNNSPWPCCFFGRRSGMRRTIRRPGT